MNIIRRIRSQLSMQLFQPYLFMDIDSGKWVNIYIDRYGVKYMATSKYDLQRVKMLQQ